MSNKGAEINSLISAISSLVVSLPDVFGEELCKEPGPHVREGILTDDSFIAANSMTGREVLGIQQALLEHGKNELTRVCYPQFALDVDLVSFTVDYSYKRFTGALKMFNMIHANFEDHDSTIPARLLKLHINWDDPSDFEVTFSNCSSLKETWELIRKAQKQTEDVSTKVESATGA